MPSRSGPSWLKRIVATLALATLVYAVILVVDLRQSTITRDANFAVLEAANPYRQEVAEAIKSGRQLPAPAAKLAPNMRALYANSDGAVILELSRDFMPGARYVFLPTRTPAGIEWRCTAERIDSQYLPATCR
jgi:hypothetical protein